jgi:hypothetical protein
VSSIVSATIVIVLFVVFCNIFSSSSTRLLYTLQL